MPNLDTVYRPGEVEARWSREWLERDLFRALPPTGNVPAYCIVIPPPNITGSLHLGHALNNTLQDILIRWHRMRGDATLWQPGTDHAGIATQNVVERQLMAKGTSREALGREAFIKLVWNWRNESGGRIIEQLKRLGASCDWSRERFTMDTEMSAVVREVFVHLYHEGKDDKDKLIYRGERLINWCPRCQTALSDIEVEHEEVQGKMYYIRYPLADRPDEFLTVATTRPETMLGDTGVAVHPEDPRYNSLIGKQILLPLTSRKIPIVGDAILVDREFGTGAVKITPAHDFNDFEAGERHGLSKISVLNEKGQIQPFLDQEGVANEVLNDIMLMDASKARTQIERWLLQRNHLVKTEDHKHAVGKCYRCRSVVEPFLSPQWFVRVNAPQNSLAQPAIDAVRQKKIRLIPETWEPNYFGWMENIKDWCISRQIWWGHQIPAWYCKTCNAEKLTWLEYSRALPQKPLTGQPSELEIPEDQKKARLWISADAKPIVATEQPVRCEDCGGNAFIQDPDVLDTWFSSALWPFSTLGWPKETPELTRFYPTSTLVTSFDILFFWVARMIMMGLHFTKQVPFKDVYIHALVRDAEGQKMSKSKGNVIDPLGLMEQYGTDALRFTLAAMASPGRDISLSEQRIEGYRNFANKLWNASRFVLINTEGHAIDDNLTQRSLADRWITARLNRCINTVWQDLEVYRFDEAANHLYQFIWHEFCDWYIELAKPRFAPDADPQEAAATRATMAATLETTLRLLHPFMPFITEEIWQKVPHDGETIVRASYPKPRPVNAEDEALEGIITNIITVITAIRTARSDSNVPPSLRLGAGLKTSAATADLILRQGKKDIERLARLSEFRAGPDLVIPHGSVVSATPLGEVFTVLTGVDQGRELIRLRNKRNEAHLELQRLDAKLTNPQFTTKAPPSVVADHTRRQGEIREQLRVLDEQIERLGKTRTL